MSTTLYPRIPRIPRLLPFVYYPNSATPYPYCLYPYCIPVLYLVYRQVGSPTTLLLPLPPNP